MKTNSPIKKLLNITRPMWDSADYDPYLRSEYQKVLNCGTAALGAEVYASSREERIVYHTCKSKLCPGCGNWATIQWQMERARTLPEASYRGIVLTLPGEIQNLFRASDKLVRALPTLGAKVLELWAWVEYQAEILIIVVPHTFGGRLNEHLHLHIMFSAGGLLPRRRRWVDQLAISQKGIHEIWRHKIREYLTGPAISEIVRGSFPDLCLHRLFDRLLEIPWQVRLANKMTKEHFIRYAGRYMRRAAISESRILSVSETQVIYREKLTRTHTYRQATCSPVEFLKMLSKHIRPRYRHGMHYFGLCSPRRKHLTNELIFALIGQAQPEEGRPPRWAGSIMRSFGYDPLLDSSGEQMHWNRSTAPKSDAC